MLVLRRGTRHEEELGVVEQDLQVLQLVAHGFRVEPVERRTGSGTTGVRSRAATRTRTASRPPLPGSSLPTSSVSFSSLKLLCDLRARTCRARLSRYAEAARPLAHVLRLRAPCCIALAVLIDVLDLAKPLRAENDVSRHFC